jgi:hypothetical protein
LSLCEEWRDTNLDSERRLSHTAVAQHHQLVQSHLPVRHLESGVRVERFAMRGGCSRVRVALPRLKYGRGGCLLPPQIAGVTSLSGRGHVNRPSVSPEGKARVPDQRASPAGRWVWLGKRREFVARRAAEKRWKVVVGSRQMYWTPLGCGGRVESKGGVPIGSW